MKSASTRTNNLPVQYLGRGSDGRTPTFSQTDFYVQHEFQHRRRGSLQLSLNVLNLFNQDTAVSKHSTYQSVNGVMPDETLFYTGQPDAGVADHRAARP